MCKSSAKDLSFVCWCCLNVSKQGSDEEAFFGHGIKRVLLPDEKTISVRLDLQLY